MGEIHLRIYNTITNFGHFPLHILHSTCPYLDKWKFLINANVEIMFLLNNLKVHLLIFVMITFVTTSRNGSGDLHVEYRSRHLETKLFNDKNNV